MSAPAPRRRRNQLVPLVASSHAHTVRPSVKIARPSSCALPEDPAASPHPANATSSGGFGNCATGKRRGQPNWPRRQSSMTVTALMFARRRPAVQVAGPRLSVHLNRTDPPGSRHRRSPADKDSWSANASRLAASPSQLHRARRAWRTRALPCLEGAGDVDQAVHLAVGLVEV